VRKKKTLQQKGFCVKIPRSNVSVLCRGDTRMPDNPDSGQLGRTKANGERVNVNVFNRTFCGRMWFPGSSGRIQTAITSFSRIQRRLKPPVLEGNHGRILDPRQVGHHISQT
jgi:hypothetical protein